MLIIGRKKIAAYIGIHPGTLDKLIKYGLPVGKLNGRLVTTSGFIEVWIIRQSMAQAKLAKKKRIAGGDEVFKKRYDSEGNYV